MYALDYQNRVAGGLGSIHGSINPSLFQACRPNTAATGVVATIDNITTTPSKLSLNTGKLIYSQALSKQYDADETITLTDYEVYHEGNKPTAEDVGAQAILTKVAQTATSVTATKNTKNVWSSSVSTLTVTIPTLGDNDEIELIFPLSSSGTFTLSGVSSHKWCNEVEKGKTNRVVVENGYITVGQYE